MCPGLLTAAQKALFIVYKLNMGTGTHGTSNFFTQTSHYRTTLVVCDFINTYARADDGNSFIISE